MKEKKNRIKKDLFNGIVCKEGNRQTAGITLIALVITIIILLILAGITISQLTGNGLFDRTKIAKDENEKQNATEAINLKITNVQISKYAEQQRMPTLKELADNFCEDNDFQYVQESSKIASLTKITNNNPTSIYTKLKEYPYEFEINSKLQLASIDGIKVATVPTNDNDEIVSMTKAELQDLINTSIDQKIHEYTNNSNAGEIFTSTFSNKAVTANTSNKLGEIELPAGKYVLVGYASYEGFDLRYHISLGGINSSAYDNCGYVRMNISTIVNVDSTEIFNFYIYPSKSITINEGHIKAIKIAD